MPEIQFDNVEPMTDEEMEAIANGDMENSIDPDLDALGSAYGDEGCDAHQATPRSWVDAVIDTHPVDNS